MAERPIKIEAKIILRITFDSHKSLDKFTKAFSSKFTKKENGETVSKRGFSSIERNIDGTWTCETFIYRDEQVEFDTFYGHYPNPVPIRTFNFG